jgi:sucrose-6-phosphate hydrolase SacC (GH32 family)
LHDIDDCGFKLQMAEGAVMENMRFENITMEHVTRPVFMTLNSHRFCRSLRDVPLPPPGKVRNIQFINIKATAGNPAVKDGMAYMAIMGVPGQKLEDIEFRNVDITFPGGGTEETARRRDVPELGDWKPEFFSFKGDLPAYGLYISHAKGITLNHVKFRLKSIEKRPAILCDDVEDFNAPDLEAQGQDGVGPVAPEVPLTTAPLYQEQYRPQFHFSSVTNWLNDPNGLVFYKGEYHLFFQHNPKRNVWGNMTWGHAVSPDLVHWTQLDPVIYPDKLGTIFSGSAVVDWKNTSGFGKEGVPPLVCIYTSNGQPATQSIAYSLDGRTFTKYEKNPVLGNVARGNRDPKVVWHESSKQWIMILFVQSFDLFSSPNLKDWTPLPTKIECGRECPDIFPMPLDGDPEKLKWVVTAASGSYIIGEFDGKEFKTEVGPFPSHFGYAVQTFSDEPKGRRIQIGWLRGTKVPYPGMPFNQQMTVPAELTLKTTPNGPRLFRLPVKELEVLRGKVHAWTDTTIVPGTNLLSGLTHDLYDIEGEIQAGSSKEVGFKARGKPVSLHFVDGRAKFRMLVDRITIEVFEDDGAKTQAMTFMPDDKAAPLDLFAVGGNAKIVSLKVHELKSIWK